MNDLITTALVPTTNIKDYFNLYYWQDDQGNPIFNRKPTETIYKRGGRSYKKIKIKKNGDTITKFQRLYKPFNQILSSEYYSLGAKRDTKERQILKTKWKFMFDTQIKKLNEVDVTGEEIIEFIMKQIKLKQIPLKYKPTETPIHYPLKKGGFRKVKVYMISFNQAITSLIEQRFNTETSIEIVKLFKSLNEKSGMEFDDYIDDWTKDIIGKYFIK